MVEEFDLETDVLLTRRVRCPGAIGGDGQWVYEERLCATI